LTEQLGDALLSYEEIHLLDDGQTHSVQIVLGENTAKVQAQGPAPEIQEKPMLLEEFCRDKGSHFSFTARLQETV
jgi:hypothetical protein